MSPRLPGWLVFLFLIAWAVFTPFIIVYNGFVKAKKYLQIA